MRRFLKFAAAFVFVFLSLLAISQNTSAATSGRKVTVRTAPVYPELAKRMHIQGVAKVEAIVRPNGSVKSTRLVGGNPVLADAAIAAVGKWKFAPADTETTEIVQVTFELP
jgi:TonB family protein